LLTWLPKALRGNGCLKRLANSQQERARSRPAHHQAGQKERCLSVAGRIQRPAL